MPSKGKYSSELGGFKSFGTEGQGDSPLGAKDTNDTTCGDRIVLLSITALEDTSDGAASTSSSASGAHPTVGAHPVVMATGTNYLTFEVGSYQFYDDLEIYASASEEESASMMKTSWMLLSAIALFMVSFTS
jgi:hypothetical protein